MLSPLTPSIPSSSSELGQREEEFAAIAMANHNRTLKWVAQNMEDPPRIGRPFHGIDIPVRQGTLYNPLW